MDLRIDYARELNEQQLAAVTAPSGPALVIAGAGAGKTRTLTYRVAYLIEQGIPAERILLLTFTNKAAREMMQRVSELLGGPQSELWGGTFHSVGHRILRRHAEALGHSKNFTILDRDDATELVKSCLDESGLDVAATRVPKADVLAEIFSLVANMGRPVAAVLAEEYPWFEGLAEAVEALRRAYEARKLADRVMDFDDLLVLWHRLLRDHADVRELYQRRFQFVLVDEYQDTNKLQAEIIDLLAARHHNIMAVGDDAQSIYSWRGADFRNILDFPRRHPTAVVYKIETNYRSTPEILALANAAIAANTEQFPKQLAAVRGAGSRPILVACDTGSDQASFVAQRALELRDEGVALNRMAVLYRSHFHTLELQLELTRRNIPFSITSGIRFFEQAHVKDVAAHLKLVCNPRDELAFKRLVRLLPGVGGKTADKLWKAFGGAMSPTEPPVAVALRACAGSVPRKAVAAWDQWAHTMEQLQDPALAGKPAAAIRLVLDGGYEDHLKDHFTNARNRLEDLQQLAVFAARFESVPELLAQLALLTNVDTEDDRAARQDDEQLRLTTIHQAKGLEFDVVFLIMLCEGLFPSERSAATQAGEEEERRLFYVAVTRARNELYLSYPVLRFREGGLETLLRPSRFLDELQTGLREEWNLRRSTRGLDSAVGCGPEVEEAEDAPF